MAPRNQTRRINRDTVEEQRKNSKNGRLQRMLSKSIFSIRYIAYLMNNPEGLLRMPYLIREVQATKRVLKALKKRLHIPWCRALYEKINMLDGAVRPTSPLCAIARHLMARSMHLDLDSLFFDGCIGEWTMETIVHGVTPYMGGLNDLTVEARECFAKIQRGMSSAKAGYVEVGAFEPDLRSIDDFTNRPALQRLCKEQGWIIPKAGGFVLCSHRLVRVQSDAVYQSLLNTEFPGFRRVLRKRLDKHKSYQENMNDILAYIWKLEQLVKGADGDIEINDGDCRRCIRVVALATTTDGMIGKSREDALCEFAFYFDKCGMDFFRISHVNIFAIEWPGQKELSTLKKPSLELIDAPDVQSDLHRHCNDTSDKLPYQEKPAYAKIPFQGKTRLKSAQPGITRLGCSREAGRLILIGRETRLSDGTKGLAASAIKHSEWYEDNRQTRATEPPPQVKRRSLTWKIEIRRSLSKR